MNFAEHMCITDRKRERIGAGSGVKPQILKAMWFFVLKSIHADRTQRRRRNIV